MKKINMGKMSPSHIIELFESCPSDEGINMKTDTGFILLTGGLLTMQKEGAIYVARKGKWKKVFDD